MRLTNQYTARSDAVRLATWASIECEKQRSGERSVAYMIAGWNYASMMGQHAPAEEMIRSLPTHIMRLGTIVEPRSNGSSWWRKKNVYISNNPTANLPDWVQVPRLMEQLCEAWLRLEADEWYKEFEEIHPFVDGNGRVGNILWNLKNHTLDPEKLAFPPNYWGGRQTKMPDVEMAQAWEMAQSFDPSQEDVERLWKELHPDHERHG